LGEGICTKRQRPGAGGEHQNDQSEADHGEPRSAGDVAQLLCYPATLSNNTNAGTLGERIAASSGMTAGTLGDNVPPIQIAGDR
jgi:hypothetical protein